MQIKPLITEKTVAEAGQHRYSFRVDKHLNKTVIKKQIESVFKVNVVNIQTAIMPGKQYRSGRRFIFKYHPDWKKATVTIKPDQKIELMETGNNS